MQSGMKVGSPILRVKNIDKVLEFYERESWFAGESKISK